MTKPGSRDTAGRVGANVRAELARRGQTQAALARATGMLESQVGKRVRGVIPFDVTELEQVALFLDVRVADLLHGIDDVDTVSGAAS